ncbi:hypothetical protein CBS101457_006284 [Exobasidium rhododendri]|nr:hypothetical protein CBS101457_006284 [Exobasidium rhododendri]
MTVAAAEAAKGPSTKREAFELDEARLASAVASEQGEVYILQWLSKVESSIKATEQAELLQFQSRLEASLLKLVYPVHVSEEITSSTTSQPQSSSPISHGIPHLGRPSRHLIARCLVLLFQKGESKSLFDVIQFLMRTAGEETKGKIIPQKEAKAGSLYIAGEIFLEHGHNVMSQFVDLTFLCQRIFKNSSHSVLVRFHALLCLSKVIVSGGRSLNDQPAKEIIKSLKQGLADGAGAVARGCADCLFALLNQTNFLSNRAEIEQIVIIGIKNLDTADFVTMRSISRLLASLLAHTQKEGLLAPPQPSKKKKKKDGQEDDSDDEAGPSTPSGNAPQGFHRTLMTPKVMFEQLSYPFLRLSTSKRGRGAILDVYATLLQELGADWVRNHYEMVLKHLIDDIPNHTRGMSTRAEVLSVRIGVGIILRKVIGERMLGENAQVGAIQEISTSFLKRWPVLMPGQHPPSKHSLVLAFNETAGLLTQLGSAPSQVLDALHEPLLRCLAHPSHSVQVSAAWCLRTLCLISPLHLMSTIEGILTKLTRDIASLTGAGDRGGADLPKRTTGHARGLAALISVIPYRPLYASFEVTDRVLDMAFELLKHSADHNLAISAVEIQVAWTLIGSLMSLGPNFARGWLNQFLNMWRSALPKPADTNGASNHRSEKEWGFLLHVRECTLGSIYSFLIHNGSALVTLDTAKRVITLLSNSLNFVNGFSALHPHIAQEQVPGAERNSLTLLDREHMVRRRVFQCFSKLAMSSALEPLQESLIAAAIRNFAEPDRYVGSAAQAAIAASSGNFTSIWDMSDGYAFGVTSLQRDGECFVALQGRQAARPTQLDLLNRDNIEEEFDALQRRPIMLAAEHDPLVLYTTILDDVSLLPPPPATAAVDASLEVFSALIPFQRRDVQISAFETILHFSRSSKLEKNPGRRMAIQANACTAVLGTLRTAMQSENRRNAAGFNNDRLTTALRELLKDALLQGDSSLRRTASEAFGRLAAISGSHAMSSQVQFLVDQVVTNRDPDARAGCALAFGAVYSEVGGLAAGPLTKTVVDILMSLSNDPHPIVHFSALEALRMVVDAASLSYSPYVASTLGMLVKLYMFSTHEPEGGSAGSVNLRADLPANQAICRVISALVGVLGPDLQDSAKVRTLILVLLMELSTEPDVGVIVEATKALQHFALFASEHLDLVAYINSLRTHLKSKQRPLKIAAINGFYQLIQRHALMISKLGGNALVEDLFAQLDGDAATEGVRQVLKNWLRQTADLSPCGWIDLCQGIMSRVSTIALPVTTTSATKAEGSKASGILQDEEVATIDLGEESQGKSSQAQQSRWRTQLFALECLHEVFVSVYKSGKMEHFDTPKNHQVGRQAQQMSTRVGDLIRMAFTASTAINSEIRLEGLTVLQDVIEYFRHARDPDFSEALLLEQHQAPIAAALTPAFTSDSTPEVVAKAVQVCAVFVGSGVVREVEKLGRILKLLTKAFESCTDASMNSLGDVKNLTPNATAMLKIAVFTAWGELQVASLQQPYLVNVMKPQVASLTPLWIASLTEFARLRADPDGSNSIALPTTGLETPFAGLVRDVLMPHYEQSWHTMLHAIAVLMSQGDKSIVKAMNGETSNSSNGATTTRSSDKPALFFFALYGLSFEALAKNVGTLRNAHISLITLLALRYLCTPQYAGSALQDDTFFSELFHLFYRVIMMDPTVAVQVRTIEVVAEIISSYGMQLLDKENELNALLPPKAKLTTSLQLIMFTMEKARGGVTPSNVAEKAILLRTCCSTLLDSMPLLGNAQQEHLFIAVFFSYAELLRDESSEVDLVGPTLGSLRELCIRSAQVSGEALQRSLHGFLSASLQTIDEMRARSGRVVTNKIKNNMLAIVVMITSLPRDFRVSKSVLEQFSFQVVQRLNVPVMEGDGVDAEGEVASVEIAMTSINCLKTIFLAASRLANPNLLFCVGQMLPLVVALLVKANRKGSKRNRRSTRVLEELLKTVGSVCSVAQDDRLRARLIGIVMPTLMLYVDNVVQEGGGDGEKDAEEEEEGKEEEERQQETLSTLVILEILTIASQHSVAFREVVSLLDSRDRQLIENSIRAAVASSRGLEKQEAPARQEAKKIALKSFG